MSESEKKSGGTTAPVVVMEQTPASRHKPIRPTELQEEASDIHQKHSKAPVVETVAEELKGLSAQNIKNSEDAMSSEKQKQNMAKKFSSSIKKRETITVAPIEMETKYETVPSLHQQPIPSSVETVASDSSHLVEVKAETSDKKGEEDSITEDVAELRTPEATKKHSDWSDDEEASGLPRSESRASRASRASRVSRAMRQLLCCGVRYEAASEDDLSPRPGYATGI